MHSFLASRSKQSLSLKLFFLAVLVILVSGWTCSVFFASCQGVGTQTQTISISPGAVSRDAESVLLIVEGNGFSTASEITWNGHTLPTTFIDAEQLQATITQQTFESFGGSAGSTVQISTSPKKTKDDFGCPINGNSGTLLLIVN